MIERAESQFWAYEIDNNDANCIILVSTKINQKVRS